MAEYAAKLYLDGFAPLIVFSGGLGRLTKDTWNKPEADRFAETAMSLGVPEDKVFIENKSTNTGENLIFTYKLLKEKNINPKKIILVQKPYMERRTFAAFKKRWPDRGVEVIVTSPPITFENYPGGEITKEQFINTMVGDLQRIREYGKNGYAIPQEIPKDVWEAWEKLVKLGFDKQLVR